AAAANAASSYRVSGQTLREAALEADPRPSRLANDLPSVGARVELCERARHALGGKTAGLEPGRGLVGTEGLELDRRSAATRSRDGRVQVPQQLVRRHEHEQAEALAEDPVDHVQEAGEALPRPLLRV